MDLASRRLAIIDLDGTLYRWSLYSDLIEQLLRLQQATPARFVESQMHRRLWGDRMSEENAYFSSYIHEWELKAISGLSEGELMTAVHEVLRQAKHRTYVFTRELIHVLREQNYFILAIGGSPQQIVTGLCKQWPFDVWKGTECVLDRLRVFARDQSAHHPIRLQKRALLQDWMNKTAGREGSIAIGDSFDDWPLLEAVEFGIAFNPERALHIKARQTGVGVVWERKDVITAYRTQPEMIGQRADAFLFQETPWEKLLPAEIGAALRLRLKEDPTSIAPDTTLV